MKNCSDIISMTTHSGDLHCRATEKLEDVPVVAVIERSVSRVIGEYLHMKCPCE